MSRIKSSQEDQNFEAYIEALFKLDNHAAIYKKLIDIEVPTPYRLRMKVVYSKTSIKLTFDELLDKGDLQYLNEKSSAYIFISKSGRLRPQEIRVPFFIASFENNGLPENIQTIITICKIDAWKAFKKLIKINYPKLVPILLSQAELIHSAKKLKKETGQEVNVRAISAKESFNGKKGDFKRSVRIWTDEDLDKALQSVQERRQTMMSVDIQFFDKIGSKANILPSVVCKIRKDGEIEVTGSFKLAFDSVAVQIAEVGERKLSFFSGRGLRVSNFDPKPLAVNFSQPVFEKIQKVQSFVKLLSHYPNSMHAVVHGNPYAHVKITDVFDGSSFDVWAISPSRIALMPGLKASEAAFERIVHYIFDKFREGNISNYDYEGKPLEISAR